MIKTFYNIEIDENLTKEISECISNKDYDKVVIYLSSFGGSEWDAQVIIDMINENKDKVEVIGYGKLLSAAFLIFMDIKCKKRILDNSYGMFHQGNWSTDIRYNGNPSSDFYKFRVKQTKSKIYPYYVDKCKEWGFNEQELKKYKKGEDVYFSYERFKELINHKSQS